MQPLELNANRAVLRNADVTGASPWLSAFGNDFWGTPLGDAGSHGSYRPLTVLSLRANALLARGTPPHAGGFHLVNVALHVACSLLVLRLGRRVLGPGGSAGSGWPAAVAALLFAVHPVHCEAVAGVVGRADLLCALFYLLALLCYANYVDWRELHRCAHPAAPSAAQPDMPPPSKDIINVVLDRILHPRPGKPAASEAAGSLPRLRPRPCSYCACWSAVLQAAALALAACATLSKEPGLTVLGVCFVYEGLVQVRRARRGQRVEPSRLAVLVACCGALLAARLWLMGLRAPRFAAADNPAAHSPSLVTRTLTFLHLPAVSVRLLLWPQQLSFDWGMDAVPRLSSLADPRNAASAVLYLALWRVARGAWRGVAGGAGLGAKPWVADANNNLPAVAAAAGRRTALRLTHAEAVVAALALLVLPALPATNLFFYVGFVVAERVLYLPSVGFCLLVAVGAHRLRRAAPPLRRHVIDAVVLGTLVALSARAVQRNADWHDEEALYRSGIAVNPAKAYGNLGSVLSTLNKLPEAEHAFRMALLHRPNMAEVHYNLGNLLAVTKRYEEAARSYRLAIQYRPTLALAYVNLGHILAKQGLVPDARRVFRECVTISAAGLKDPVAHESARASALLHLAHLEAGVGNLADAKQALDLALRIRPAHYEAGPLLKLMSEVADGLKANRTATQKAAKTVVLPDAAEPAALTAPAADDAAPTSLNESRCATTDGRRMLSHS